MINNKDKITYYMGSPTLGEEAGTREHNIIWLRQFYNAQKEGRTVLCFEVDNTSFKKNCWKYGEAKYLELSIEIEKTIDEYIKKHR